MYIISLGTEEDKEYVRKKALELKEEIPLKTKGHTIHFDHTLDKLELGRIRLYFQILKFLMLILSPRMRD
ncbi:phosphoenolpyruvate carboxykinase [Sulfolobus islandicus REY15A]|uniref:Phosphoenolpyruvate carboxykinase n=1 Tax=Saccharolobus islandicus (strain REY15A) TaxID=930945 RepID=F0NBU5_SACI5|nr:phosphoenolpyruvate carboxykinase [Sulfolobus islandicus REY15A]